MVMPVCEARGNNGERWYTGYKTRLRSYIKYEGESAPGKRGKVPVVQRIMRVNC